MASTLAATGPASVYVPVPAEIIGIDGLTAQEKLFRLRLVSGEPLGHAPGQFVQVSIAGFGESPISICSPPTRPGAFELCVRRVGTVTNYIHQLEIGDTVGIRGPLGHGFDLSEFYGRDVVIVAGGLAIAPARSLIQHILDEREHFGQFHLLYGARNPDELLFRSDLRFWEDSPHVHFHVTVDRGDHAWRGRTGVVTTLFSELPRLDPENTVAAVVGPPVMFKFVVIELLARGIRQRNVFCSLERRMKCGVGKCGHCQANQVYCCVEGPVFKYGQLKALREALE